MGTYRERILAESFTVHIVDEELRELTRRFFVDDNFTVVDDAGRVVDVTITVNPGRRDLVMDTGDYLTTQPMPDPARLGRLARHTRLFLLDPNRTWRTDEQPHARRPSPPRSTTGGIPGGLAPRSGVDLDRRVGHRCHRCLLHHRGDLDGNRPRRRDRRTEDGMTTVCGARRCTRPATDGGLCRTHAEDHQYRQVVAVMTPRG